MARLVARSLAGKPLAPASPPPPPPPPNNSAPAPPSPPAPVRPGPPSGLLRRFLNRLSRGRGGRAPPLLASPHEQLRDIARAVLVNPCPVCGGSKPGADALGGSAVGGGVGGGGGGPGGSATGTTSDDIAAQAFSCDGCGYPSHCSATCRDADTAHVGGGSCARLALVHTDEHAVRQRPPPAVYAEFDRRIAVPPLDRPELGGWGGYLSTRGLILAEEFSNAHYVRYLSNALTYPLTIAAHARGSLGAFEARAAARALANTSTGTTGTTAADDAADANKNDAIDARAHPAADDPAAESPASANTTDPAANGSAGRSQRTSTSNQGGAPGQSESPLADDVFTILVAGARAEAHLPLHLWHELSYLHPHTRLHLVLSGPEVPETMHEQQAEVGTSMLVTWLSAPYTGAAKCLEEWGIVPDLVTAFHPGVGSPGGVDRWGTSFAHMLATGSPVLISSFDASDLADDLRALEPVLSAAGVARGDASGSWEVPPCENPFRSLMGEVEPHDINRVISANHAVFSVRAPAAK
jgi:hypothetical protein